MDITKHFILFFKLLPFIIVCYFLLYSLFFFDLKGIIYLTGLLISCIVAVTVGKLSNLETNAPNSDCQILFLNNSDNNRPLSPIPLNIISMIFLLSYYFTIIIKHKKFKDNAITAILLLIVVLSYVVWFYFMSNCSDKDSTNIGITLFLGIGLGIFWSIFIMETGISELQYFNGISSAEICSMPTKKIYRCTIKP